MNETVNTHRISPTAQAAQDAARRGDGQFGNQPHADPGIVSAEQDQPLGMDLVRAKVLHLDDRDHPSAHPLEECFEERNFYGRPVVQPEYFTALHTAAMVPVAAGIPPVCSCGFTRVPKGDGTFVELHDHLSEMGPFGDARQWTRQARKDHKLPRYEDVKDSLDPFDPSLWASLSDHDAWLVGTAIQLLPDLDDDEFQRLAEPLVRKQLGMPGRMPIADRFLFNAYHRDSARRHVAAGHTGTCAAEGPIGQLYRRVALEDPEAWVPDAAACDPGCR